MTEKKKTEKKACKTATAKAAPAKSATAKRTRKPAAAKAKTQKVLFSVHADVGSEVYVAGDFNNWDPTVTKLADAAGNGLFTAEIPLAAGVYQYKFVINGTWCADPDNAEWTQNPFGTLNSIKRV